jgi:protein-S-isoprenylcysteine O-methyltransferase Ste14
VFVQTPDSVFEWALAGVGGITFIVFAVALQNFFVQPATLTRGQRFFQDMSVLLGVTHVLALLVLDSVSDARAGLGIAMYVAALSLFLAAIEAAKRVPMTRAFVYEPRCSDIIRGGPYRIIRHPIYLSYSLAWSAAPLATQNLFLAATAGIMIGCYISSAREEERLMSLGALREEYAEWQRRTWRLIPFVY